MFRRFFWDCACGMEMHADVPIGKSGYWDFQFIEKTESSLELQPDDLALPENFEIFLCALGSSNRDVMKIIKFRDSHTDQDLFRELRNAYVKIRGWRLWFSFTYVHDIRFVRFYRNFKSTKQLISYGDALCDIKGESLPDIDDDEYEISPRQPPSYIIRPMTRQAIMDHFLSPGAGATGASDCLRYAMPKKVKFSLPSGICEAWGLYAEEAVCPTKVLLWGLAVYTICLTILLPWWVVWLLYLGTVFVNVLSRVGKTRRYGYRYDYTRVLAS
ncbi:hypothetical protein TWF281_003762 [Arthrobotrys megalospora]